MARNVIEKLVDDLDGGDATETVTFALDGTSYDWTSARSTQQPSANGVAVPARGRIPQAVVHQYQLADGR